MRKFSGLCDSPTEPDKCLQLDPRHMPRERARTAIHEAMHACLWDIDEAAIDEAAEDIERFLHRLKAAGYLE